MDLDGCARSSVRDGADIRSAGHDVSWDKDAAASSRVCLPVLFLVAYLKGPGPGRLRREPLCDIRDVLAKRFDTSSK